MSCNHTLHFRFLRIFITLGIAVLLTTPFGCGEKTEKPQTPTVANHVPPPPADKEPVMDAEPEPAAAPANAAHITDIHFNPFYDPKLVPQLLKAKVEEWEGIFESSEVTGYGTVNSSETNYNLLMASLKQMSETTGNPDFIIFTGDFLAHDFNKKFTDAGGQQDNYESFVDNTIAFMVMQFKSFFKQTPVYLSLGNNDCYRGDYQITADGAFLHNTAPLLAGEWLIDSANRDAFNRTYPLGGYFSIDPPNSDNTRIISLNSIFFSPKHNNTVDYDPGQKQLDWFEAQLKGAMQTNVNVWLLLHIPPGANVYSTEHDHSYVPMWKTAYNSRFIQLLQTYAGVVTAGYCGHTHMDDYRLLINLQAPSKGIAFIRIGPAVSPQFGNNPGYQHLLYDNTTFNLSNFKLYFLNLETADPTAARFQLEYSFTKAYGQTSITASSLLDFYHALATNPKDQTLYREYYDVGNTAQEPTDAQFKGYWCGIGHWQKEGFQQCANSKSGNQ